MIDPHGARFNRDSGAVRLPGGAGRRVRCHEEQQKKGAINGGNHAQIFKRNLMTQAERDLNNRDSQSVDSAELSLLRAIVEGTAPKTGEDFFRTLVRNLCTATGARGAFVAYFDQPGIDRESCDTGYL